jgi:predicted nucleic acid-binding protein
MTRVVLDTSVVLPWLVEEDQSDLARRLPVSGMSLLAPEFLLLELANAFVMRQRRGRPNPPGYPEAGLVEIRSGGINWTSDAVLLDSAMAIARRHLHPVYDCLYFALARREEAMLATFDRRLTLLAERLAIPLWSPETSQETP